MKLLYMKWPAAAVAILLFWHWPVVPVAAGPPARSRLPENLARKAHVVASSEYSEHYRARFAIDGQVPGCGRRNDLDRAWCVKGAQARDRAEFVLEWDRPVTAAELVYYGRTAWISGECWKDYEIYADDRARPVAKGRFLMAHGPQRVRLGGITVRRLRIKFLSSYGGPNPGASEIQVFATSPPPGSLPKLRRLVHGRPWIMPEPSAKLARLIDSGKLGFRKLLLIKRHEINPSHVYTAYCEGFRPGGGIYLLEPPKPDGRLTELLATPDGQILDLDLSYDGREIVFSWRKDSSVGYHIFRMNIDGSGLKQLTDGPWHDYNACWLPDGGIAFVSTRAQVFALCFTTPSGVLYRMDRDGGHVRQLSSNYVNDFTPSVLPDGRILYSRWEYVDRPAIPIQSLWTIHPDGRHSRVLFGNRVLSPASFLQAKPMPDRHRILCTLTAHNGPIRGAVGLIDNRWGLNGQTAITNLTPEIDIGRVDRGDGNHVRGPYETPNPIDEQRYIVSAAGTLMLGEVGTGLAPLYASPDQMGCYDGTVVAARPVPPVLSDEPRGPAPTHGDSATVFVIDVYRGLEPEVKRGEIKALMVVEEVAKPLRTAVLGFGFQRPVISCGATYAVKKVWGTVPVEPDGSAHFTVPADRPLYFLALDAAGRAVQRMRSFVHFQAGETRSCIGCHEHRNTTPPAVAGLAALRAEPRRLQPPSWGLANFDYCRLVQPVLDRHCVRCHNGTDPQGGVDLSADKTDWFNVSYDVLSRGYVNWIDTRNGREANILRVRPNTWGTPASKLTSLLLSGHPDQQGKPRVQLERDSLRRIFTWIDLNIPYYSTYEMADESRPGGRRLYPAGLDKRLADVWARRCSDCHGSRPRRPGFVRITQPELNPFLAAPLARSAGGRGRCRPSPPFRSADDPDYQDLLKLFEPVRHSLAQRPRMDMPGATPALVSRSRL